VVAAPGETLTERQPPVHGSADFSNAVQFPAHLVEARRVLAVLLDLIEFPRSVVDLGGNTGAWCKAFKEAGATRVLCIDHPGVRSDRMMIEENEFMPCDLRAALPEPVPCDMALCLEVLEHLPAAAGEAALDFLTQSAPLVLFSAGVPGQPGWEHINSRPPSYWKDAFQRRGFERFDIIRPRILGDTSLPFWYRQNIFLFAGREGLSRLRVRHLAFEEIPDDFELLHQRVLETSRRPGQVTIGSLLRQLLATVSRSARYRTRRMKS